MILRYQLLQCGRKQAALLTTFALDVAHKRQCPHQLMEALSSACSRTARFSHSLLGRAFSCTELDYCSAFMAWDRPYTSSSRLSLSASILLISTWRLDTTGHGWAPQLAASSTRGAGSCQAAVAKAVTLRAP